MAKQQTFADKASKLSKKSGSIIIDPESGKETKLLNVKLVESTKTTKGTWKFLVRMQKVYESSLKPYEG
ncbi:MAG: hypothetical protein K8I03_14490 [Ignavibacteria bacterium]|nr:hypothetical protein [Ignavibacteria bacterium]MCC6551382.1 hypothetical protein [Ignavibacteriaceae bacterium]